MELLKQLTAIRGASSDEGNIAQFILDYVAQNTPNWKVQPTVLSGGDFHDCVVLIFGKPTTAIYAHIDTIGYSVGYENNLIKIGGPTIEDGIQLVGCDSQGEIATELMVIENDDDTISLTCVFDRTIDRGTILTYKPNFIESDVYVQSPYLDNRLGVWSALKVAEQLENGAIVFSTYEEHGGNSVGFCANYLYQNYNIRQALISDITWVTPGVLHGKGVAISLRDKYLPRKSFLNKIVALAEQSGVMFQLEVESAGGSDGSLLQLSHLPIDWCFIGAPEDHVHTPNELVYKSDIMNMVLLYQYLMEKLD
ncbi:MAG TPA: aminopeptidase [Taishania sp.]|nr:aminopeptidase [Taishania sp.]HNS43334.1 aminopeptidase [Taishania sp.]